MDSRKRVILRAVVEEYIEKAEPIGSKTLSGKAGLDVSPATLRNEMSALEDLGYLEHPHTSSGRVPTTAGYRLYVDELMRRRRLTRREMESINAAIGLRLRTLDGMLAEAGRLISKLTSYAAFAVAPAVNLARILRFEAFLTDPTALVLVLAAEGGVVKTKWVRLTRPARQRDIARLAQSLNAVYAGACEFDEDMARRCAEMCGEAAVYLPFALQLLDEIDSKPQEVFLSGETQLLDQPEFRDLMRARKTLEFLSERRQSLTKLSAPSESIAARGGHDGVRILVGPENVADELRDASVIVASYQLNDGLRGMIGLVGPTRMDYSRLESRLSYFASRLNKLLGKQEDDP
ncbi:MAG: heat-inducible transcriptional repressor HrcA [Oscillospiraceae bacterium]|nr:heat-inducible transcriptional repressor HrcA [Oscillospiraceae bacterium]